MKIQVRAALHCMAVVVITAFAPLGLNAQIFPAEHQRLHYKIICFYDSSVGNSAAATLEIAMGSVFDEVSFKQKQFLSKKMNATRAIAEVPAFVREYTWRIKTAKDKGTFHHFSCAPNKYIDTSNYRIRVEKQATTYKEAFFFMDGTASLYNMKGEIVWTLPNINGISEQTAMVRDLKLSPAGTITLLLNDTPLEIDWNGNILWRAPKATEANSNRDNYHHEFTRMPSGNYAVCGNQSGIRPDINRTVAYGTVDVFTPGGKTVFSWKSVDVYKNFYATLGHKLKDIFDAHMNSFYLDENKGVLYAGFKHTSHIIKIEYPEGIVLNKFGRRFKYDLESYFYEQHSIKMNKKGEIYIFDNHNKNNTFGEFCPQIFVFKEVPDTTWAIQPVWQYAHAPKSMRALPPGGPIPTIGGNVQELPDGSFFTSMCSPYSDLFIVNRKKEILWLAVPEEKTEGCWQTHSQYRASVITSRKALDALILNAQPLKTASIVP